MRRATACREASLSGVGFCRAEKRGNDVSGFFDPLGTQTKGRGYTGVVAGQPGIVISNTTIQGSNS